MSSESETAKEVQLLQLKKKQKKTNTSKEKEVTEKESSNDKPTTKEMVNQALTELYSKKGTSLYAIKKYLNNTYKINSEKLNPHIKRYIKASVENGTIIQTKGTGASGSFKLVINDKNVKTNAKKRKPEVAKEQKEKKKKQKVEPPEVVTSEISKKKPRIHEEENDKQIKKKPRFAKTSKTPSKMKSLTAKRKSIGTIIKPPKMKPLTPKRVKAGKKK